MDSTLIIEKERKVNANAKAVWNVLTNPKEIKKWLGVETKSKWTPKSEITFTFTWDGKEYVDRGEIICFDEEKEFSYFYWSGFSGLSDLPENYSKITFLIEPKEIGVILKLSHSDFATRTMYEHSNKNWEAALDEIKTISEKAVVN